jgi:hypothetical protein
MGPKMLRTIWGTYMKLAINSCREKCDEKCAYMFNVYKNQLSRKTGSRNLTGPKTLPTIWHTYMKLVTKYQIPVNQIPTSSLPTLLIFIHIEHTFCICPFLVAFFSATIDDRNLIFGHKLHIGTPYRAKMLPTIWHTYMKLVTKYQIPVINSCLEKCDKKCAYTNVTYMHIFRYIFLGNY